MKNEILYYLQTEVSEGLEEDQIEVQDDLLGSGLVDSLGMMRLIQFIETKANLSIPPEDMTIDNFMTVAHICTYLESKY